MPKEKWGWWFFLGSCISQAKLSHTVITNNPNILVYYSRKDLFLSHVLCPLCIAYGSAPIHLHFWKTDEQRCLLAEAPLVVMAEGKTNLLNAVLALEDSAQNCHMLSLLTKQVPGSIWVYSSCWEEYHIRVYNKYNPPHTWLYVFSYEDFKGCNILVKDPDSFVWINSWLYSSLL